MSCWVTEVARDRVKAVAGTLTGTIIKEKGPPFEDDEPSFERRHSETGLDWVQVTVSFSILLLRAEAP